MSITAAVENDSIKLPPGVHVPDGTKVEITMSEDSVTEPKPGGTLQRILKYAGIIEGPEDFAAEHDHYVHGTSKRSDK